MSYQIRFNSDALLNAAMMFDNVKDRLNAVFSRMNYLGEEIDRAWDGAASNAAISELRDISCAIKNCAEYAAQGNSALRETSKIFSSAANQGFAVLLPSILVGALKSSASISKAVFKLPVEREIRINIQQMRSVARSCRSAGVELDDIGHFCRDILVKLQREWEGNACERFLDKYRELERTLMRLSDIIVEFAMEMLSMADRYQAVDGGKG